MNRPLLVNSRGFSLIEVLITLLLTSIGILGMVALQAKAITYTQDSIQRNTAATLADELMEIMRSDRDKIITVHGAPRPTSDYYRDSGDPFPVAATNCPSLPSTPSERLRCWGKRVKDTLPVTDTLLVSDFYIKPVGDTVEIQLAWVVPKEACLDASDTNSANSVICHYRLSSEL